MHFNLSHDFETGSFVQMVYFVHSLLVIDSLPKQLHQVITWCLMKVGWSIRPLDVHHATALDHAQMPLSIQLTD